MAAIQKKMNCFQENICRLCPKTFCCKDCREQHEEQFHKVNPKCEICIYGRMTIKNASVLLLNHIKTTHWPLHCVFCKKVFNSLDELVPHEKCTMKTENVKPQVTPKTPVTPVGEHNEPSPMITPFYKSDATGKLMINSIPSNLITSTPLIRKEESEDGIGDKIITPLNDNENKCIYKSSLKLTGSSNLSDSKKSERKVTFSDTPSVTEVSRKPKYLPLEERNDLLEAEDNSDDCHSSVREEDEMFKTVSTPRTFEEDMKKKLKVVPNLDTFSEEKENIDNQTSASKKAVDSDTSLWESALNNSRFEASKTENVMNQFNLSLQINVFNETPRSNTSSNVNSSTASISLKKTTSLWSSMTNIVKSVMTNISMSGHNSFNSVSIKRAQPDSDSEAPCYKRMKLTDIKCRRPIREISPLYNIRVRRPHCVDKATQTDEPWI